MDLLLCQGCEKEFDESERYSFKNGDSACPYCYSTDIIDSPCQDGCQRNCIHDK